MVVLVILLFLQTWRATVIPVIAIPISLIGTCAMMLMLGYSINTLTLFGLVLAVGIAVDDAIVVVENVERRLKEGLAPARRGARDHGRGRHGPHLDRAGAVGGIHPDGVRQRHHWPVLPPVRRHHCFGDDHLGLRVADAVAGAGGDPVQAVTTITPSLGS